MGEKKGGVGTLRRYHVRPERVAPCTAGLVTYIDVDKETTLCSAHTTRYGWMSLRPDGRKRGLVLTSLDLI